MYRRQVIPGILIIIVLFFSVSVVPVGALTFTPDFEPDTDAVYLVNLDTGNVVYEKNADVPHVPASLTKIMTVILALEYYDDLDVKLVAPVEVFNELYGRNASNANMSIGEEMSVRDLLYATMLKSGCDSAGVLAYHIGGESLSAFVEKMNAKAKEIGAEHTVFADAHGLDNDTQRTTAYDMYLITRYALAIPEFAEISTTYYYELSPTNKRGEDNSTRYITHTSPLMNPSSKSFYNSNVQGIKTGTSGVNTKTLVSMAQKNGNTYLLVQLGAPNRDADGNMTESVLKDANALFKWVFDDFSMRSVIDVDEYVREVPVALSSGNEYVLALPQKEVLELLPNNLDLAKEIDQTVVTNEDLMAPVRKGDVIGSMELSYQGEIFATVNLVAGDNVERSTLKFVVYQTKLFFSNKWVQLAGVLLVLLIVAYIILVVVHNKKKKKRLSMKKGRRF